MTTLRIKAVNSKQLTPPSYATIMAAGLDICAAEPGTVKAHSRALIGTGWAMSWDDPNYYMRVAPRSGLSVKKSIDIGAGVIDPDYRGEIKVCVINNGDEDFVFDRDTRIAQLILTPYRQATTIARVDNLDDTERGSNGFGSTDLPKGSTV
jgi:dUTP pyrophosphatase